ncbi:LANO_0B04148g1_1 [Lachancea nothofagi CBS 11611]|uniref:LANO_0B04148g1_1 n=1 Tax=Lachancea nothofagi CBS 11611 TaxID=1266666 RepID=A0A1G4IXD3_9SACH|nr:LANO_0B04148g1_1 [Lachancea nothofagi CBS 11611]
MTENLPPIYNFPPLYTCQPNVLIREQQLNTWCDLLLEYAKNNNAWCINQEGFIMGTSESNNNTIFKNESIQRAAPAPFIDQIWRKMLQSQKVVKSSSGVYFMLWRTIDYWSSLMLQWFETCGKLNQVVTLYELLEGDESLNWEFHGMHQSLCEECLQRLCDRGRATLLKEQNKVMGIKVL